MIRIALVGALLLGGCQWNSGTEDDKADAKTEMAATASRSETEPKAAAKRPDRAMAGAYVRPGFAVYEQDGRLWVFKPGSEAHAEFLAKGEPAKRVTLVGAGPDRKTLMGADLETLEAYRAGLPGRP